MSTSDVHGPRQNIFYFKIAFRIPELIRIAILALIFTNNITDNFLKYLRRGHMQNSLDMFHILFSQSHFQKSENTTELKKTAHPIVYNICHNQFYKYIKFAFAIYCPIVPQELFSIYHNPFENLFKNHALSFGSLTYIMYLKKIIPELLFLFIKFLKFTIWQVFSEPWGHSIIPNERKCPCLRELTFQCRRHNIKQ